MHPTPDYESYSKDELIDVYENIDKDAFPDRFLKILSLLEDKIKEEVDFLKTDPSSKAKRIDDFFNSLPEKHSEYHTNSNGVDYGSGDVVGCGGGDGGGGE